MCEQCDIGWYIIVLLSTCTWPRSHQPWKFNWRPEQVSDSPKCLIIQINLVYRPQIITALVFTDDIPQFLQSAYYSDTGDWFTKVPHYAVMVTGSLFTNNILPLCLFIRTKWLWTITLLLWGYFVKIQLATSMYLQTWPRLKGTQKLACCSIGSFNPLGTSNKDRVTVLLQHNAAVKAL